VSEIETKQEGGVAARETSSTGRKHSSHRVWMRLARKALTLREGQLFLLLAVIIGVFSGLVVVCFRIAIEWTRLWLLGSSLAPSRLRVLLVPAIGGIFVALLVIYLFPRVRGSGVNQTKAAVYVFDGYVSFRTVIGKFLVCALAIGSGQSLGPEDPSLQIGAGIASALGRKLQLSREKVRLLAPIGAAAGLAAAFNAPIAAVLFVIEEVIGNWSGGVLGAIVLSAVSSVVTMRWFLGSESLFRIPPFRLEHPAELLAYGVLGIIGGLASLVFLKFIAYARPRLQALPRWTKFVQPAIAGFLVGIIAVRLPQVLGAGYPFVDQALHDQFMWKMLLLLGLAKILATGISFVSGTPGGMFAPTLFIGAMIGGAVGGVEHLLFPRLAGSVGTFALVGMGALFAGFLRTPITSVFMVVEVSGSYSAIVPVMICNTIAYLISRRYQRVPLFDLLSHQDGIDLPSIEALREQQTLRVEDTMRSAVSAVLRAEERLEDVRRRMADSPESLFLVRHPAGVWTALEKEQLMNGLPGAADARVRDLPSRGPLPFLYPDQSLEEAMRLMGDWPIVPVLNRADLDCLEGAISLADILHAYRAAADRQTSAPNELA
jgi:chloride channel protein, CIC family